jgi:hypothetical protein
VLRLEHLGTVDSVLSDVRPPVRPEMVLLPLAGFSVSMLLVAPLVDAPAPTTVLLFVAAAILSAAAVADRFRLYVTVAGSTVLAAAMVLLATTAVGTVVSLASICVLVTLAAAVLVYAAPERSRWRRHPPAFAHHPDSVLSPTVPSLTVPSPLQKNVLAALVAHLDDEYLEDVSTVDTAAVSVLGRPPLHIQVMPPRMVDEAEVVEVVALASIFDLDGFEHNPAWVVNQLNETTSLHRWIVLGPTRLVTAAVGLPVRAADLASPYIDVVRQAISDLHADVIDKIAELDRRLGFDPELALHPNTLARLNVDLVAEPDQNRWRSLQAPAVFRDYLTRHVPPRDRRWFRDHERLLLVPLCDGAGMWNVAPVGAVGVDTSAVNPTIGAGLAVSGLLPYRLPADAAATLAMALNRDERLEDNERVGAFTGAWSAWRDRLDDTALLRHTVFYPSFYAERVDPVELVAEAVRTVNAANRAFIGE